MINEDGADDTFSFIRSKRANILLNQALLYPVIGYHATTLGQKDFFSTFSELNYFFREFLYKYSNGNIKLDEEVNDAASYTYEKAISRLEGLSATDGDTFPELASIFQTIVKAIFSSEDPYDFSMNRDVSEAFSFLAYSGSKLYVFNDYRDSLITASLNERFNYLNAGILEEVIELYAKELIKRTRYNKEILQEAISDELSEDIESLSENLTTYKLTFSTTIPSVISSFSEYITTLLKTINNWIGDEYETTALESLVYLKETYESILQRILNYSGNISSNVVALYESTYLIGTFIENPYGKSDFTYSSNLQKLEKKVIGAYKCGATFQNLYINFIDCFTEYLEENNAASKFTYEILFEQSVEEEEEDESTENEEETEE